MELTTAVSDLLPELKVSILNGKSVGKGERLKKKSLVLSCASEEDSQQTLIFPRDW